MLGRSNCFVVGFGSPKGLPGLGENYPLLCRPLHFAIMAKSIFAYDKGFFINLCVKTVIVVIVALRCVSLHKLPKEEHKNQSKKTPIKLVHIVESAAWMCKAILEVEVRPLALQSLLGEICYPCLVPVISIGMSLGMLCDCYYCRVSITWILQAS